MAIVTRDEHSRVQRIKQYVLTRLREELAHAPRGGQAALAKSLGVSGAHLSNMLSPSPSRQPGEEFRRKAAEHWGISYADLEALALGEEPPPSAAKPVTHSDDLPANLKSVLADYAWMGELGNELRIIVREQARLHVRFGPNDLPRIEWQRIVTGLEREALAFAERRARASESRTARSSAARKSRRARH